MGKTYTLDMVAFRTWLEGVPSETSVGVSCDDTRCPLACWLSNTYLERFHVGLETIHICDPLLVFVPPLWVTLFVEAIDVHLSSQHISASRALQLLDRVQASLAVSSVRKDVV